MVEKKVFEEFKKWSSDEYGFFFTLLALLIVSIILMFHLDFDWSSTALFGVAMVAFWGAVFRWLYLVIKQS
ncbi:MAG TPA: hypothetical protein VFM02_02345 [Candidatus Paceibacterota bacterium]|nr:hypothetical protein [Candidatus Paceibacterota bacterium]